MTSFDNHNGRGREINVFNRSLISYFYDLFIYKCNGIILWTIILILYGVSYGNLHSDELAINCSQGNGSIKSIRRYFVYPPNGSLKIATYGEKIDIKKDDHLIVDNGHFLKDDWPNKISYDNGVFSISNVTYEDAGTYYFTGLCRYGTLLTIVNLIIVDVNATELPLETLKITQAMTTPYKEIGTSPGVEQVNFTTTPGGHLMKENRLPKSEVIAIVFGISVILIATTIIIILICYLQRKRVRSWCAGRNFLDLIRRSKQRDCQNEVRQPLDQQPMSDRGKANPAIPPVMIEVGEHTLLNDNQHVKDIAGLDVHC